MKFLQPLTLQDKYYQGIEREIVQLLLQVVYNPLMRDMTGAVLEVQNSISALLDAIRRGVVWYDDGYFQGEYSAGISKELKMLGAVFNHQKNAWEYERDFLPPAISFAIADAADRASAMRKQMLSTLNNVDMSRIIEQSNTKAQYAQTLNMMESAFQTTIKGVESIGIAPVLTETQREMITTQWADNLDLYIKDWTQEATSKLRNDIVMPHALSGGRPESIMKVLQESYGTTKAKARFLAHQETSLLLSKFRESRYDDIGIQEYKWSGAMDARERPDHRRLQGKIYRFDSPPVTNLKTGARNNPGEDYGCRCTAIPVIK